MTRGCPFGTPGNEVSADDGRLAGRADTQRMADFCLATIQGAMLMGKIKRSSQSVEAVAREAVAHVKSYLVKS
jgi:hypothetical protein